jgi:hypothetical protein
MYLVLTLAGLIACRVATAAELGPQGVIRQFCQADGNGQRASIPGWAALAPLVMWSYEPAWDHVTLVTGYTVGSATPAGDNIVAVEVRYEVIGELTPSGMNPEPHVETVTYRVQSDDQGNWRILGPLPPPHIFGNRVDIEAMRRSLAEGGVNFLANTVFVWQMFRSAGWNVPFVPTTELLSGAAYRGVDSPKPGDVVVYLCDGAAYHVALLEATDQVVSSTLNAGVVRTAVHAFPGEVRYLRLVQPDVAPTIAESEPPPAAPPRAATPVVRPTPTTPSKRPTRVAAAVKQKKKPAKLSKAQRKAKPAARKRVQPKRKSAPKRPRPTPGAAQGPPR